MSEPTATDLVLASADRLRALIQQTTGPSPLLPVAKFDNRPTWSNNTPAFDNRPTWDNWNKK
ncbi:multiple cyclophane-containing RiPP AmcA [Streptomyces sp. NPDC050485]|uniref:multiple cyclophane-containing RiPP AmcA n=1 Tax=Streptomyces sp. NPDC050485 TaxID=3365617 RepID=UPI0037AC0372